jgi:DNA polymerase III delta prime subunit
MKDLENAFEGGSLHHAYLMPYSEASHDTVVRFIEKKLGFKTVGNPDVHVFNYTLFGIDDGRMIQSLESNRAVTQGKKIFVLSCDSMTREAQNALLKVFEEPTEGTHFFVFVKAIHDILPTLLSRMQLITPEKTEGDTAFAEAFLKKTPAKRLELLKDIFETKDKTKAVALLNMLETTLREEISLEKASVPDLQLFTEIATARSYLNDRGASLKMLLEHLSMIIPRVA